MRTVEQIRADMAVHKALKEQCAEMKKQIRAIVDTRRIDTDLNKRHLIRQQLRIIELKARMDNLENKLKATQKEKPESRTLSV